MSRSLEDLRDDGGRRAAPRRFRLRTAGTTLAIFALAATGVVAASSSGTGASWVGAQTVSIPAISSGKVTATITGFSGMAATYDATTLSKTGSLTLKNTGTVSAAITATTALNSGYSTALNSATTVTFWSVASASTCATATVPTTATKGTWTALTVTSTTLAAGATTIYCIRTDIRPSALKTVGALTATVTATLKAAGTNWSSTVSQAAKQQITANAWSPYSNLIVAGGASKYWPLGETSGSTLYDWAGTDDALTGAGITRTSTATSSPSTLSTLFSGTSTGVASTQTAAAAPSTFAVEAWFSTTTTTGGRLFGFSSSATGTSSTYDRHLYMDATGKLYFGVYNGTTSSVSTTAALNDGAWHHVVANLSTAGLELWVDGARVALDKTLTSAQSGTGYWRFGGDSTWAGDNWFDGSLQNVAVYPAVLSKSVIQSHWTTAGRTIPANTAYGAQVAADSPSVWWKLDEASSATSIVDSSSTGLSGNYNGSVTKAVTGALTGSLADSFNGTDAFLTSAYAYPAPSVFSFELWFSTTSTTGGKLIGTGNSSGAHSTQFDRHIVMSNDGKLVYGIYQSGALLLKSTASYNDGAWHHVVVTQSSTGGRMYVDGSLVGTNTAMTTPESATGYLHIGADSVWSEMGASSNYFKGSIDEVAIYTQELTAAQIANHYAQGW